MDDTKLLRQLLGDFEKKELISIAEELGLTVSKKVRAPTVIKKVFQDLDENGVPELDDCSDELYEFLVAAEVIDEEGNIIEKGGTLTETESKDEDSDEEEIRRPECFGFADKRDPACKKCSIYENCLMARVASRPSCFAVMFDLNSEECDVCLEGAHCREQQEENKE